MSPKSTHALLVAFALLCCVGFTGCADETDVTKSARFDDVKGKCFATREDMFLHYSETANDYCLAPAAGEDATSDMPISVEEYRAHPEKFGPNTLPLIVGIVPAGTRIQVTRLFDEHGADGSLAFGRVMNGKFSGKQVGIWELFDDPDSPKSPTAKINRFEAKSAYLEPVECGK